MDDIDTKRNDAPGSASAIFTIPNLLSFIRLALIPVIAWLYCARRDGLMAGIVLIISGATDLADGYIARRFHMISDLGKILDPVADKLTQAVMLICLLFSFPWMAVPIALMAAKEIFMSVTGIIIIRRTGIVTGANIYGKIATFLLYAMILLHFFWPGITHAISIASVAACTAAILVSFASYAMQNIRLLRESRR